MEKKCNNIYLSKAFFKKKDVKGQLFLNFGNKYVSENDLSE